MSVHVISWVLKHSEARLADRLVLLVLADHASGDGTDSYPSVATIAHEARISERAVQYSLRKLEKDGHISRAGWSLLKTNNYSVLMTGADSAPVSDIAPKPSLANAHRTTSYLRSVTDNGLGAESDQTASKADLDWFDREQAESA